MHGSGSNTNASTQKIVQSHNISAQGKQTVGKGSTAKQQQVKWTVMEEACTCISTCLDLCEKNSNNVQGTVSFIYRKSLTYVSGSSRNPMRNSNYT
jgi:hypothetical protein